MAEQGTLLNEFPPAARSRVVRWFEEQRSKGGTPEEIVTRVVDAVNRHLRGWAGGGAHYEADCRLVRLCHEKRDLALAFAAAAPSTPDVHGRLWQTWSALFRKADAMGLDPEPLDSWATEADLRAAGSALWQRVRDEEERRKRDGG